MCGGPGIICMGAPIGGLMPPKGNRSAQLYIKSHISAFKTQLDLEVLRSYSLIRGVEIIVFVTIIIYIIKLLPSHFFVFEERWKIYIVSINAIYF